MRDLDILWRRVAAYFIDYIVIALFAIGLGLTVLLIRDIFAVLQVDINTAVDTAFKGHFIGIITLTIPALIYFGKTESSRKQASFGKRALGLKVETLTSKKPTFRRALLRAIILLMPWELAHIGIWYGAERPFVDPPASWALGLMISAQLLLLIYFFAALRSPKRSIHDEIAKLQVVRV